MSIHQQQDRLSKWFLNQHGKAFLKLCNFNNVIDFRLEPPEKVAPRRLSDGLLQVTFSDRPREVPFLIEIESYPSLDNSRQMTEAMMTYALAEHRWPEAILLILRPSKNAPPNTHRPPQPDTESMTYTSDCGTSGAEFRWRTIRMWELQAEDLFAFNDPTIIPMIPLTCSDQSPEELLRRCHKVIDQSDYEYKQNLRLVTELVADFVYNDTNLLDILRENKVFEFPYITRLKEAAIAEGKAEGISEGMTKGIDIGRLQALVQSIMDVLETRFGNVPVSLKQKLDAINSVDQLKPLVKLSAVCPNLATFESSM